MLKEADSLKGRNVIVALIYAVSVGCMAVYQKGIGTYGLSKLFQVFQLSL